MPPRKVGDTTPFLWTLLNGARGTDLTGMTLRLVMRQRKTNVVKIDNVLITINNVATGDVSYAPTPSDVDTAGIYQIEIYDSVSGARWPTDGYEILEIEPHL